MNYRYLIGAGAAHLAKYPGRDPVSRLADIFPSGARWMAGKLGELNDETRLLFDPDINYNLYGSMKYGICVAGFILSVCWCLKHGPLLIPLSILVFYLLEVQFLFLFPLLIDHSKHPVLSGLREVWKIGVIKCILVVIPISVFMMIGLFRKKDRFRNWYIGCLAILIWYNDVIRTRLSSPV